MATDLAKLQVALEAQTTKFEEGLDRAMRRMSRYERQQKRSLNQIKKAFIAVFSVEAVRRIGGMVSAIGNANVELNNMARQLGTTTADLMEFQIAGKAVGLSMDRVNDVLKELQIRSSDAQTGTGDAAEAFEELNISAAKFSKLPLDNQLRVLAAELDKVESHADQLRLSEWFFGESGPEFLANMDTFIEQVDEIDGKVDDWAKASDGLANAWLELKKVTADYFRLWLTPVVTKVTEWLSAIKETINDVAWLAGMLGIGGRGGGGDGGLTIGITGGNDAEDHNVQLGAGETNLKRAGGAGRAAKMGSANKFFGNMVMGAVGMTMGVAAEANAYLVGLENSLKTEEQIYDERMAQLQHFIDAKQGLETRAAAVMVEMEAQRAEQIKQQDRDALNERLGYAADFFGQMAFLANNQNARLAEIGRASAIMQIGFSTAQAVMSAMAEPGWPYPARLAMAASVAAMGAMQAATVAGARAMGGEVTGGRAYLVGERGPELMVPSASGTVVPNHAMGGINVTLIEDASRAGQVSQGPSGVEVAVARIKAELRNDIRQGRGIAGDLQSTYRLNRRT